MGRQRYEIRNWRDLKIAHLRPDAEEAQRPKRGRPSKTSSSGDATAQSEPDFHTDARNKIIQDGGKINKPSASTSHKQPVDDSRGKIQTPLTNKVNSSPNTRPTRSTRNPSPLYVDSIAWSASEEELKSLNSSINSHRRGNNS